MRKINWFDVLWFLIVQHHCDPQVQDHWAKLYLAFIISGHVYSFPLVVAYLVQDTIAFIPCKTFKYKAVDISETATLSEFFFGRSTENKCGAHKPIVFMWWGELQKKMYNTLVSAVSSFNFLIHVTRWEFTNSEPWAGAGGSLSELIVHWLE